MLSKQELEPRDRLFCQLWYKGRAKPKLIPARSIERIYETGDLKDINLEVPAWHFAHFVNCELESDQTGTHEIPTMNEKKIFL